MGGVLQRSLILNFKIDAIHYLTYLFICSFCEPVVFFVSIGAGFPITH